jgi:hypothetical protein
MTRRTFLAAVASVVMVHLSAGAHAAPPDRLTSRQFWSLMTSASEPEGNFRSDNLVSNEIKFQWVIPELLRRVRPGGVYIGVGPEQNFTYIAALKAKLAFIIDVRRGNTDLHLMYKALFELATDRADFVSRLLSRPRPAGLTAGSSAADIFSAFSTVDPSERLLNATLASIRHQLTTVHRFPLDGSDLARLEAIHRALRQLRRDDPADVRRVDVGHRRGDGATELSGERAGVRVHQGSRAAQRAGAARRRFRRAEDDPGGRQLRTP